MGQDKLQLGLNFPNLPYLIDGDYNITESSAIMNYIIKRWGKCELLGKNNQDSARLECFLSIFNEIAGAVRMLFFNKEHETAKVEVLQRYSNKLDDLNRYIGENGFVLGYLTLADFIVAENSYYIETVYPEQFKTWSFLLRIRNNFNALPEIAAYYKSSSAFKGDFFPPYAFLKVPLPAEIAA